jgi:NADPH:quinone reductase-like Zn-dependent oxidoreductase
MKALVLTHRDGEDGLAVRDVPEPERPRGWAVMRTARACLNRVDIYMRRSGAGITHRLPMILGLDAAGEIVEADADGGLRVGDQVLGYPLLFCGRCRYCRAGDHPLCEDAAYCGEHRDGVFAELAALPAANFLKLPADADLQAAAALPCAYLTAFRMVFGKVPLQAWETVLIQGVGGGVSLAALQLAVAIGARAIVTSTRDEVLERASAMGAAAGVNSAREQVAQAVLDLTGGTGADMVIENVGEATWRQSLRAVRRGGRIVVCGATTGGMPPAELQRLFIRQIAIYGSTLGSLEELRRLVAMWGRGAFVPVVDRVFPFREAVAALDLLEGGEHFGKVGLDMAAT